MATYHTPVLLQPVCALLDIRPGHKYVDATIGGGGHAQSILDRGGLVLGIDQDDQAISYCQHSEALQPALASGRLVLAKANFIHLSELVHQYSWKPLSGILIDLGVSSHQFDEASRGFSFQAAGPLDMRMDLSLSNSAATLVNTLSAKDLAHLLSVFGEVTDSQTVARRITSARPLESTQDLYSVLGHSPQLSRQVFQALRIAVNDELGALDIVLPQCLDLLEASGKLAIISFHSLEDRLVKTTFASWQKSGLGTVLTSKPVVADEAEIKANSRSHSAKLRVFTHI